MTGKAAVFFAMVLTAIVLVVASIAAGSVTVAPKSVALQWVVGSDGALAVTSGRRTFSTRLIKIDETPTYRGTCGGAVKDGRGEEVCCGGASRPVCYSNGICTCQYDDHCAACESEKSCSEPACNNEASTWDPEEE